MEKEKDFSLYLSEVKEQLQSKEKELLDITSRASILETEKSNLTEKLSEQKDQILKLYGQMNIEFKNLANEILEEKTKKFTLQNRESLDAILKPLSEKIKDFEKKVEETYDKEAQQRFSLKEEVKKLAELNQKISEEAGNLTRALKGESKTQGDWGEMILESILDKSGLVKGREYLTQQNIKDAEGKNQRPDVIVQYPGDRYIIIDSKVSLKAYEKLCSSDDEKEKEQAMKDHLSSVRNHVLSLSRSNYQDLYDVKSLDFIMLFMPVEHAYLTAMHNDPELWSYAYEKRIILMSPTNLIASLKMISSLWRQEYQNRYAREIAKKSGDLLDKFYSMLEDLMDVGNKLKATQKSYDESIKKLHTGKGNLIRRTEEIQNLGARATKNLPRELKEKMEGEE